MSKRMVPEELNLHIQSAIDQLSLLFSDWLKSHNAALESKATLVAFWVKDYCHFLRNEKCFSPQSVPRLKRGSVIVVDFGFRLGKEFGGRHFAAVLDNDNKLHSPIVTVVPLFSLKESYKPSRYTCYLPDGVYSALNNRITGKFTEDQPARIRGKSRPADKLAAYDRRNQTPKIRQRCEYLPNYDHKQNSY